MVKSSNVVDFDDSLRIIGTAHVSSKSVALVKEQISEYSPDVVAVELCESRMASLMEPESLDSPVCFKCSRKTEPSRHLDGIPVEFVKNVSRTQCTIT